MYNIRMFSDFHGMLPKIAPCDSLLIAGDVCSVVGSHDPAIQANYINTTFYAYLLDTLKDVGEIVITPGNHDFVFEEPYLTDWLHFPEGVTVLVDEEYQLKNGMKVWGSPWCPNLQTWAFYQDDVSLYDRGQIIPEDMDIWLMHSPPYGYGDRIKRGLYVGNKGILPAVREKNPSYYVCGHIHEAYGRKLLGASNIVNCSFLDELYEPQWRHYELQFDDGNEKLIPRIGGEANPQLLFYDCRENL